MINQVLFVTAQEYDTLAYAGALPPRTAIRVVPLAQRTIAACYRPQQMELDVMAEDGTTTYVNVTSAAFNSLCHSASPDNFLENLQNS